MYEGVRKILISKFSEDVHTYGSSNAQVSMEMLITHLAHASTLKTKWQICTWLLTFVSHAYKGQACAAASRLIIELRDMEDVNEPGEAEVQAGESDVVADCLAFMEQYPQGLLSLEALEVQASWEEIRTQYCFGVDSFKAIRYGACYKHLRKIVAACLAGSFLSERLFTDHKWFHKRLFEGVDHKGDVDPMDLLDEVLELSKLVLDTATRCVQSGSLRPLLGRGKEAYDLDTEHAWITAHHEYFEMGSLADVTTNNGGLVTDEAYILRVEKHLASIKRHHAGATGAERTVLQKRLTDCMKWQAAIQLLVMRASLRMEPYSVFLYGATAQGKTATGMSLVKLLLQDNGFPYTQDVVAQVDSSSRFMDTVQNSTLAIVMDDVANTVPAYQTYDALSQFIAINNTSVLPVSKAGVDEKGKVTHRSVLALVSSNVADLNANMTSNEPSSILRRFKVAVKVTIAPEFAYQYDATTVHGLHGMRSLDMIDPSKLTDGIYSDHQRFELMTWVPKERTDAEPKDTGNWFTTIVDGRVMKDLHFDELMRYLCVHSKKHYRNQRRMLNAFKADEQLPICPHGGVTAPFCRICKAERTTTLAVQAGDRLTDFFFPSASSLDEFDVPDVTDQSIASSVSTPSVASAPAMDTPETFRDRFRMRREAAAEAVRAAWEHATVAPPPPVAPPVVGWLKAWSHGVLDVERLALTHFDAVMLCVLSVAPLTAMLSASFLSLFGAGWWFSNIIGTFAFSYTGITLSRNMRGWVSARVAGATLRELQQRSYEMARSSFGVLATIIGVLALIQGLRSMTRSSKPSCSPVRETRCEARQEHAQQTEQHQESAPTIVPAVASVEAPVPLDMQGGCATKSSGAPVDPVPKANVWERRDVEVVHYTYGNTRNMTREQIIDKLARQTTVMTIVYESGNTVESNCFIVATNHMVAPAHNFVQPDGTWAKIKTLSIQVSTQKRGTVFTVKLAPSQLYRLPGDAMLVQMNAGGSQPDMFEHLADEMPQVGFPGLELYRDPATCVVQDQRYLVVPEAVSCPTHGMEYWGMSYIRSGPTFKGLCGASILTNERYPRLMGFHTMGVTGQHRGVACCITRRDIEDGIQALRTTGPLSCPVVVQNTTTPYTPTGMESAGVIAPLSAISVARQMPSDAGGRIVGTLANHIHSTTKTRIGVSPISRIIEEECGEARAHEAPRNIGKATVEVMKLKEMAGRTSLNAQDWDLARRDLHDELCAVVESIEFQPYFKVHTVSEACSGLAGSSSMRSINTGTAAGWPFLGNKKPFLLAEPRPGLPDAFTLKPEVESDLRDVERRMATLQRVNFMFKVSHKDEAVKIGKEKVRGFEGSPLLLTLLFRMYFMPIIRLYLLARLLTGCAVGIDATSGEWQEMFSFFLEFNPTEAIIGDWRHFDTSQSYQEMMTVFCIWIDVMQKYGSYTQEQINVMWVIAEETCRHYALYRGDVVQTEGSNPSGGAGTVYINNPVGALRFMAGFYGMAREQGEIACDTLFEHVPGRYTTGGLAIVRNGRAGLQPLLPNLRGRYSDYVRTMLYGDDFVHAPKPVVVGWFNQQTLHSYFAQEGLHLTDANKQPFESATTPWEEVTFLKRGFRLDEDTKCVMAPLEMGSIYKCLHVWPKKLAWAPEVHAAQIFCGSLRELFQHGRSVYDARAPALLRAAERIGSLPYMAEQVTSYDEMRAEWIAREMKRVGTFAEHTAPSE